MPVLQPELKGRPCTGQQDNQNMTMQSRRATQLPHIPLWPLTGAENTTDVVQLRPRNLLNEEIIITELLSGNRIAITDGKALPVDAGSTGGDPWLTSAQSSHGWKTLGLEQTLHGQALRTGPNSRYRREDTDDNLYLHTAVDENKILSWEETELLAETLNMSAVPLVFHGKINDREEMDDFLRIALRQPSHIHGYRNGLVIRQARAIPIGDYHLCSARLKA